jgi:putative NADH-flavin reductase
MKVTLFGATGKTGRYLIEEALRRGVEVTVFARSGTPFADPRVRIVRGELTDEKSLAEAIRGADAVLSALGPTRLDHPNDLPIARATKAIISVMGQEGVERFIATSTGTARPDPGDAFDFWVWFPARLIQLLLPTSYADMVALADAIRESELDWTMARLAILTNGKASKKLNVGLYGHTRHSLTISREDVAGFMLDKIASRDIVRQAPGISAG